MASPGLEKVDGVATGWVTCVGSTRPSADARAALRLYDSVAFSHYSPSPRTPASLRSPLTVA